jgi:hypothetical protein
MVELPSRSLPSSLSSRLEEIAELCRRYHVRSLELFGSALTDGFDSGRSDIDFLVEFDPVSPRNIFEDYFPLKWDLEKVLATSVDLVEPGSIRNPYFRLEVDRRRLPLYAA